MIKIVILVSGDGSNFRAIQSEINVGHCNASIVGVVSDRRSAGALQYAKDQGIATRVLPLKKDANRHKWNEQIVETVVSFNCKLVVLAGFMRILGNPLLDRFPGHIINVHPAILPTFPGHNAPEQAISAGVRVSGCTVHVVDAGIDTGPIIAQAVVPVASNDTPTSLHARIQVQEHVLLPRVIHAIATDAIRLNPLRLTHSSLNTDVLLIHPKF